MFEAGDVMEVLKNCGGLELTRVMRCHVCKRKYRDVTARVDERDVRLLPPDYVPEKDYQHGLSADATRLKDALVATSQQLAEWGLNDGPLDNSRKLKVNMDDVHHLERTIHEALAQVSVFLDDLDG